ncbi:MAG TPA: CBS domain-containing protein [Gemmatimonadaceae bacterium]|nr:CBS domain-containing protein [Gemmatimonadaceae bacterium]
MKIQDVMTRDPSCVTPDTPARDAARLMKDEDIGIVPVVDGDGRQLVGVVTDRDIAIRLVAEGRESSTRVRDVMSRDTLATCRPDGDLDEVMDLMAQEQVRRVPIVDERGSLVGIVSQADVVRASNDGKAERTVEEISQPGGQHSQ